MSYYAVHNVRFVLEIIINNNALHDGMGECL